MVDLVYMSRVATPLTLCDDAMLDHATFGTRPIAPWFCYTGGMAGALRAD
jgi:hypothetical protein